MKRRLNQKQLKVAKPRDPNFKVLMSKRGGVHEKTEKALRRGNKQNLHKEIEL